MRHCRQHGSVSKGGIMWLAKEKARHEARVAARVAAKVTAEVTDKVTAERDKAWVDWLQSQNIAPPQTPPTSEK